MHQDVLPYTTRRDRRVNIAPSLKGDYLQKAIGGRFYYGWVVVAVVFLALLVSAGVRAAPAVLINPLEGELGWSRATISFAVSIGLLLYGLSGPVAGWLMDRFGPKRVVVFGLVVIGVAPSPVQP